MTIAQLESRIASLEQKVADLTGNGSGPNPVDPNAWIDQIHGTFQNDATYRLAARLGSEWRRSGRKPAAPRSRKVAAK